MQGRPPVILQVLPSLQAGGVERGTIEMVRAIAQAGGTPLVASAGGRMVSQVARAGGRHVTLRLMTKDPLGIWMNAWRLARLIRRERVDLVHARSRAPAWSAWLAARRTGAAFVTTWHGAYSENLPFKKRYNSIMARGERVIAISRFVAERLRSDYAVGPDRLRIIPRGADLAAFDPAAIRGDRLHALASDWNLPFGAKVIMLAGRITPWKGHELLLRALARLPADAPDWVCVLVGPRQREGTHANALLAQAHELGLMKRLRFAGHCEDMPAAYALADLVVMPSLKPEPFGRVVIEAQAMGRPVLVAGHGGAMETVEDGVSGVVFPPGDVDALAQGLARLLALDPAERATFAEQARAHVAEHYCLQAMQRSTLAVYDELLGRQPDPPRWRGS
ncbi:glycosyltransferase family 4 protein [Lichenicoccus roseus]|uniref:glycosyltransferase family 4 protein n=1 Tax=Lichenicoccus roseus TaxID=2683649 RepID=UPI001F10CB0A|nr:glycosyltransferase family 4 protein [Lichenicoccus roseus]